MTYSITRKPHYIYCAHGLCSLPIVSHTTRTRRAVVVLLGRIDRSATPGGGLNIYRGSCIHPRRQCPILHNNIVHYLIQSSIVARIRKGSAGPESCACSVELEQQLLRSFRSLLVPRKMPSTDGSLSISSPTQRRTAAFTSLPQTPASCSITLSDVSAEHTWPSTVLVHRAAGFRQES